MRRPHSYHPHALEAVQVLGLQIAAERRRRVMTSAELCERAQVSPVTLRNVERGDPNVAVGIYFETATVLGIQLFGDEELSPRVERMRDRLALLPARVRRLDDEPDDNF